MNARAIDIKSKLPALAMKSTPAGNPLSEVAPEDTLRSVQAVLGFVSCALSAMQAQDDSEYDLADAGIGGGLKLIIDTCQEAIGAHVTAKEMGTQYADRAGVRHG